MAGISETIAKVGGVARDTLGTAEALRGILPAPISKALSSIFGFGGNPSAYTEKSINTFNSNLNKLRGVQRTSHYYVRIPVPNKLDKTSNYNSETEAITVVGSGVDRELGLLCESCVLPGISLNTTEIRRYGFGAQEKKPYAPTFVDQTFTFMGDNSGKVHRFFYQWMNSIVGFSQSHTIPSKAFGLEPYQVEYKKDSSGFPNYTVDITITTVDEANRTINEVTLFDAYPIFLGDVQLSWAESDSYVRFPVTFTFTHWRLERVDVTPPIGSKAYTPSLFDKINKAATAIQVLAAIRRPQGIADIVNAAGNIKIVSGAFF